MRVLVLSTVFPNAVRPTLGVFVRERVRHVARHCEVVVLAPIPWFPFNRLIRGRERAGAPFAEEQEGLRVYHPRVLSIPRAGKCLDGVLYFLSVWPVAAWLRRRFAFDRIDAHFLYPDGVAGVLLGRAFRCPSFVTLRGTEIYHARFALRRPQMRFALDRAARVIAVSDALRQAAARLTARTDVRVIPNGVDATAFTPADRAAARAALGLPADRAIVLGVGALIERKGHHRVVELLPSLVRRRPDILYVAVGGDVPGDSNRAVVERLIRRHGLEEHVRMVPAQPHHEIPRWLAAADLFCLATRFEGWCNALTEALACGVPVVTTDVGGNGEFVRHGLDGYLVPFWDPDAFADALVRALDAPWDRPAIAARMRAHGWGRTAEQVVAEFASVSKGETGNGSAGRYRILYHHRTGGGDAQGIHIAKMIQAFRDLGHEVDVVGVVNPGESATPGRLHRWLTPVRDRLPRWLYDGLSLAYNLYGFVTLARAIRRRRPDLLYERYALNTLCGIWASRCFHVPIALEVNAPLYQEQRDLGGLALHRVARATQRWICSSATRTFVVTRRLGEILQADGVPAAKLTVLPNGIDPAEFDPATSGREMRDRYGLDGHVVIGFVGWFRAWHGLELLLEAFAEAGLARHDAALLLVGDGPALPALRRQVDAHGLEKNVIFTGAVPREEIAPHIAAFDIAVQPGATDYASPMKLFEYMAMARCIVAPAQANVREVLVDGVTARLFPAGDRGALAVALRELAEAPAARARLGQRAWAEVDARGYLWSANARRVVDAVLAGAR
jgi:glycosyltransferase involved in cell wall biosynthesis